MAARKGEPGARSPTAGPAPSVAVYQLDSLSAAGAGRYPQLLQLTSELRGLSKTPATTSAIPATGPRGGRQPAAHPGLEPLSVARSAGRRAAGAALPPRIARARWCAAGSLTAARRARPRHLGLPAAPGRTGALLPRAKAAPTGWLGFELKTGTGPQTVMLQTDSRRDSTYRWRCSALLGALRRAPVPLAMRARPRLTSRRRHVQAQVQAAYLVAHRRIRLPAPRYGLVLRPARAAVHARRLHPLQGDGRGAARVRAGRDRAQKAGRIPLHRAGPLTTPFSRKTRWCCSMACRCSTSTS